ncbi:sigma-70 family RNA polymerase sigma factor [Myxococcota bacterium]|nr:sigma-70 family RNA polymerase sigma factor [Myxococcota bacterium]MBU1382454.1 sigma-70 family RNA polymerase sigma factor [Myxococcota bacterium]MBU1495573.1 sigma-70 family RNA polymerase sigma factor [Myxococcota bacterium]
MTIYSDYSESDIVKLLLDGNDSVFPEFYNRFFRLIVSCVRKVYVKHFIDFSEEEVDDAASQVFLNLVKDDYKKLRLFDSEKGYKFSSWIGLISTNTAYDLLRKRKNDTTSLNDDDKYIPEPVSSFPSPPDELIRREEITCMLTAIDMLTDKEKRFLELAFEHDLSPEEIAFQLGLSLNTVYSKKNKIKIKLAEMVRQLMDKKNPG